MHLRRFQQRATLGARYVKEYVLDEFVDPYERSYLMPKPLGERSLLVSGDGFWAACAAM